MEEETGEQRIEITSPGSGHSFRERGMGESFVAPTLRGDRESSKGNLNRKIPYVSTTVDALTGRRKPEC